jgi:hypothetical protein
MNALLPHQSREGKCHMGIFHSFSKTLVGSEKRVIGAMAQL